MPDPKEIEKLYAQLQDWLSHQPQAIQRLARDWPPTARVVQGERWLYIIGWEEPDILLCTARNPAEDYEGACAAAFAVHEKDLKRIPFQ